MRTFRHAGDRGDIIAALPAVRALGGGLFLIEAAAYTRELLVPDKWNGLDAILKEQPYISGVQRWMGERADFNMNDWRAKLFKSIRVVPPVNHKNLADWQLEQYGIPLAAKEEAWLQFAEPIKSARVVFNRTGAGRPAHHIYQNHLFPWHLVWEKYHDEAVFVGSIEEHRIFCATCGRVPYLATANLHEAARVIAGADLFVGNQSVCYWIAEGLKKNLILEVWRNGQNCLSNRPGAHMGFDENVVLPNL